MGPPALRTFRSAAHFHAWLEKHHAAASELIVRCYKSHARGKGLTYPQALDEALCFGWIDGVRHGLDEDSFSVRFSPRKPKSVWSRVNTRRARELRAAGRMRPPGLAAFERGRPSRYSFESRPAKLDAAYEEKLRRNGRAWASFQSQPPWYRRTTTFWVMSARREETRVRRLLALIDCSARGETIPPLTRAAKGAAPPAGRRADRRRG